jgi:hypothetical protein
MVLSKCSQPRRGGRCITGGGAKRNRRTIAARYQKSRRDEIINHRKIISPLQGFVWEVPSWRLRFAPPPVMHITPHAGLRNLTIMRNIRT